MDAIDPSKFHQLSIDSGLAGTANRIFKAGVGIRQAGTDIASTWKGLGEPYKGPGAHRLIGAVGPVQAQADRFGWEVGQVGTALRDFAGEIGPLRAKLDQLHQQAVQLRSEQLADPHWSKKQSMVDRHNQLISSEAIAWNQVVLAAEKCANRINHLIGGVQYHPSTDGKAAAPNELGYDPHLLPAKLPKGVKTDWGTTVGRDKPWWEDGLDGAGGFLRGLAVDGPLDFGKGIAGMAGFAPDTKGHWHWDWHNSWETYKTAGAMGLGGLVGTPAMTALPGARRRGIEGWKNLGKGFIALDDWHKDKGRAAGKVSFNILTLGIPETRLGMAGRGGDIALATTRAMAKADLFNRGITFGIRSGIRGASAGIDGATRLAGHIADMPKIRSMLPSLYRLDTAAGRLPHSPMDPPHDPPTAQPAHTTPRPHTPTSGAAHDVPRRAPSDLPRVRDLVDHIGKPYERPMHDLDRRLASHPPAEHAPTAPDRHPAMVGARNEATHNPGAHVGSGHTATGRPHTFSGDGHPTEHGPPGHGVRDNGSPLHEGALANTHGSGGPGGGSNGVPHDHTPGENPELERRTVTRDSDLAPGHRKPFGKDHELNPNTQYEVTDKKGHFRGTFITDETGHIKHVYTNSGRVGRWNPDLRNPLPDATYHVDGRYTYVTDHVGRVVEAHGTLEHTGSDRARRMNTDQHAVGREGRDEYREYNKRMIKEFHEEFGRDPQPGEIPLYEDVKWNGSHYFGTEYGGAGERCNIIPMLETLNQAKKGKSYVDNYRCLEQLWGRLLSENPGAKIDVSIYSEFGPSSKAPHTINVHYWIDGKTQRPLRYTNVPPRV